MNFRTYWASWAVLAATVSTLSALGYYVDKIQADLSRWAIVADRGGILAPPGSYLVAAWLIYILFFAIGAIGITMALLTGASTRAVQSRLARRSLADAYNDHCAAIGKIVNRIYNPVDPAEEPRPRVDFTRVNGLFEVDAAGNTRVTLDYEVVAGDVAAHFWNVKLGVDGFAAPLETLADIDFSVEPLDPGFDLQEIQIDNSGAERRVALFFLPEIQPHETRRFRVRYYWKRWFSELFKTRSSDWVWSYRSNTPANVADVTFTFMFEKACGTITCENLLNMRPAAKLDDKIDKRGIKWTYHDPAAPVGKSGWKLRFGRS